MSDINETGRPATTKPFSYTSHAATKGQRPRGRTGSNSSTSSAASAGSARSLEQFVFSPHQTPASEKSPFFSHIEYSSSHSPRTHNISWEPPRNSLISHFSSDSDTTTPHSRPIDIGLPSSLSKKTKDSSVHTLIPPLSARGDISGGYFPLHEDPEARIHRPHPFHSAEKEAQPDCGVESQAPSGRITQAARPWPVPDRRAPIAPAPVSAPPGHFPMLRTTEMPSSRGHTPVTSYVPSGLQETHMPVGKYYPSNYEQRQKKSRHTSRSSTRPQPATSPSSVKSDTIVPQINRADPRGRPDSEAKMRLLQYQRDMITQAQLAKQRIENGSTSADLSATGLHGAPLQRLQKISNPRGPRSPRLEPLGSPGPVTPLALEGADGYLSARSRASPRDRPRPVPSPDAGRESHAVARAIMAHDERRRREGRGSPAVEAGGFGF